MKYFTIYKTVNHINDKYYIGAHKTSNTNDSYLGSGKAITAAVKKHGKDNFTKEVLYILETEEEMYIKEKEMITEDIILDPQSYNLKPGGGGGFYNIDSRGDNNSMRNPAVAEKNLKSRQKTIEETPGLKEYLAEVSKNNLKKAVEVNTGKKRPEHAELLRNIKGNTYSITSADGDTVDVKNLAKYARDNNLSYAMLCTCYKDEVVAGSKNPKKSKTTQAVNTIGYSVVLKERYEAIRNDR